MVVKSYDRRCYDLAAVFLGDEPTIHNETNIHTLALEIQQCIEDEMRFMLNETPVSPAERATPSAPDASIPAQRPRE